MRAMISKDRLDFIVDELKPQLWGGAVSTYLPRLAEAKVDDLGVAMQACEDEVLTAGLEGTTFSLQSVVKILTLLLAIHDRGEEHVFSRVGREQTTGAFNSFETFIRATGSPANPFVNSGALTVVDLLDGDSAEERVLRVVELVRRMTDNPTIEVNRDLALEEFARSDRNRAIGYYLRSGGLITACVEDLVWAYCQMCAIEVSAVDLSRAGWYLAKDEQIASVPELPTARDVRQVRRLMLTTGMYLGSGWYACKVGLPAKSGISGAMLGIVPQVGGVGVYGPALDGSSNSIGGIRLMEALSAELNLY